MVPQPTSPLMRTSPLPPGDIAFRVLTHMDYASSGAPETAAEASSQAPLDLVAEAERLGVAPIELGETEEEERPAEPAAAEPQVRGETGLLCCRICM